MPMVAPAPVTFSMMIDWPSVSFMWSPMMRAIVSVGPPAGNGTMMVIGLRRIVLRLRAGDARKRDRQRRDDVKTFMVPPGCH